MTDSEYDLRARTFTEVQKMAMSFVLVRIRGFSIIRGRNGLGVGDAAEQAVSIGVKLGIALEVSGRATKGEWREQNEWLCRNLFPGNKPLAPPNKSVFFKIVPVQSANAGKPVTEPTAKESANG